MRSSGRPHAPHRSTSTSFACRGADGVFIELIDSLRCPVDHDESWLVASIVERSGRDIVAGTLGCPVCRAEYPIRDSIAVFGGGAFASPASSGPYADTDAE